MKPVRRTWAEINLDYARQNWEILKAQCGQKAFCPVVKADAYGHGAEKFATLYKKLGAKLFAVATLEEALELHSLGTTKALVLGYTPPHAAALLERHRVTQTIFDSDYAQALSANLPPILPDGPLNVHIKLDTGMGRLGFNCRSMAAAKESVQEIVKACRLPGLCPTGIYTHFATADTTDEHSLRFLQEQYQRFSYVVGEIKKFYPHITAHCANSATALSAPQIKSDLCRMGIVLYGLSPDIHFPLPQGLKPVMCLKTQVSMLKTIAAGDCVGYGCTYQASGPRTVATLPVGYADGYRRDLSNKGYVLIGGQKAPVIGRVCMDQTMVDVTGLQVALQDEVILFGDSAGQLSADHLAELCGTIGYEIVCGISKRVPRLYIQNGELL